MRKQSSKPPTLGRAANKTQQRWDKPGLENLGEVMGQLGGIWHHLSGSPGFCTRSSCQAQEPFKRAGVPHSPAYPPAEQRTTHTSWLSGKGSEYCALQPAGHPCAQSDGPSSWRHKQPSKKVAPVLIWPEALSPFPSTPHHPHPRRAGPSSSPSRVSPSNPHLKPVEHKPHSTPVPGVSPDSGVHCRHTVFQRVAGR